HLAAVDAPDRGRIAGIGMLRKGIMQQNPQTVMLQCSKAIPLDHALFRRLFSEVFTFIVGNRAGGIGVAL
ncbi:MAG: hypothetical protein OXC65_07350, partial [Thiotrichales bacterium]|nr:hypothetical protein [Thiotrichales bacterium]